eukprot:764512-Hanusia_phi.AAC.3
MIVPQLLELAELQENLSSLVDLLTSHADQLRYSPLLPLPSCPLFSHTLLSSLTSLFLFHASRPLRVFHHRFRCLDQQDIALPVIPRTRALAELARARSSRDELLREHVNELELVSPTLAPSSSLPALLSSSSTLSSSLLPFSSLPPPSPMDHLRFLSASSLTSPLPFPPV